jgi:hypothetical protein
MVSQEQYKKKVGKQITWRDNLVENCCLPAFSLVVQFLTVPENMYLYEVHSGENTGIIQLGDQFCLI